MSAQALLAAVNSIVAAVEHSPELVRAIAGVFSALDRVADPTPAVKHLEAVAAAHELGISYP